MPAARPPRRRRYVALPPAAAAGSPRASAPERVATRSPLPRAPVHPAPTAPPTVQIPRHTAQRAPLPPAIVYRESADLEIRRGGGTRSPGVSSPKFKRPHHLLAGKECGAIQRVPLVDEDIRPPRDDRDDRREVDNVRPVSSGQFQYR